MKIRDLSGQRFGYLLAISVAGKNNSGATLWNCECQCGNQTQATLINLVQGNTKSCGCMRHESRSRRDLTGQRFGRLIVLETRGNLHWLCQCDCGNQSLVRTVHLTHNHTLSCGCLLRNANPTDKQLERRERNQSARWIKSVKQDAAFCCDACGSQEKLHSHHVMPWEHFAELRTNNENGSCLCASCHRSVHRMICNGKDFGLALATQIAQQKGGFIADLFRLLTSDVGGKTIAMQAIKKLLPNQPKLC